MHGVFFDFGEIERLRGVARNGCLHEAIVGATVGATGCGNYAYYSQSRRTA